MNEKACPAAPAELLESVDLDGIEISSLPCAGLPIRLFARIGALPLYEEAGRLSVAVANGACLDQLDELRFACARAIVPRLAEPRQLAKLLEAYLAHADQRSAPSSSDTSADACLRRLAQACVRLRGSDLHFEPEGERFTVRIRIDGELRTLERLPAALGERCMMRLKLLAGLDVGEQRLPQDGSLSISPEDRYTLSFRLATLPTVRGEKASLRLVDAPYQALSLDELGLDPLPLAALKRALEAARGLILVCGPTGSGKTITLYSALMHIDRQRRHVVSAEQPVEHRLPGVQQLQVEPRIGLDFTVALRAFLRQDPDVMMIGEIRDPQSAEITLKAARTGHLVLATVHAASARASLARLAHLGADERDLAECVTLVIAQRLIPTLCPACRVPAPSAQKADLAMELGLTADTLSPHVARGCRHCHNGHAGRIAIFEVLSRPIDRSGAEEVDGLRRAGLYKVAQGVISRQALERAL